MFSSGTTGVPKCIVHSAGGALLMHLKEHMLTATCGPRPGVLFHHRGYGMMWNGWSPAFAAGAR